ncbi:MAG: DciA family protein [Pseudomonadota bacterium]
MSQRLNSYLGTSQELQRLARQAALLRALQLLYQQLAPAALARGSHVLQLAQQTLLLAADNGAVAAKLRQIAPELTLQMQNNGYEVTGIKVRVQVTQSPPLGAPPAQLSAEGQQQLQDLAQKLPDSSLKNAVQRLAAKRRNKDKD